MATYNKRGYKTPKEKVENDTPVENIIIDEKDSTTAGVFNSLDQTASKTEEFVAKHQKTIFGIVAAVAIVTVSYVLFQKFVAEPKEDNAASEMFLAQQNFQKATDGTKSDSLYNLALKGSEGKFGFIESMSQLEERMIYGMYPDVINHRHDARQVLQDLTTSYLYKDVLSVIGIRKPQLLEKLLKALALQLGAEVSYNELSNLLEIDKGTVIKYIDILEKSFIVFQLNSFI